MLFTGGSLSRRLGDSRGPCYWGHRGPAACPMLGLEDDEEEG